MTLKLFWAEVTDCKVTEYKKSKMYAIYQGGRMYSDSGEAFSLPPRERPNAYRSQQVAGISNICTWNVSYITGHTDFINTHTKYNKNMHLLNPPYLMALLLKDISLNRGKGQFHALSTLKIKTCNSAITISNGSKKNLLTTRSQVIKLSQFSVQGLQKQNANYIKHFCFDFLQPKHIFN